MSVWSSNSSLAAKLQADKSSPTTSQPSPSPKEEKPVEEPKKGKDEKKPTAAAVAKGGKPARSTESNKPKAEEKKVEEKKQGKEQPSKDATDKTEKSQSQEKPVEAKKPETPTSNRPTASDPIVNAKPAPRHVDPNQPLVVLPAHIQKNVKTAAYKFIGQVPKVPAQQASVAQAGDVPPEASSTAPLGVPQGQSQPHGQQSYNTAGPPSYDGGSFNSGYNNGYASYNQGGYQNQGGYNQNYYNPNFRGGGGRQYNNSYYPQGQQPQYANHPAYNRGGGTFRPYNPVRYYGPAYQQQQQGYNEQPQE